jgi:hypothetical protein
VSSTISQGAVLLAFGPSDHQFEKMEIYIGKKRRRVEDPPQQMMLF